MKCVCAVYIGEQRGAEPPSRDPSLPIQTQALFMAESSFLNPKKGAQGWQVLDM